MADATSSASRRLLRSGQVAKALDVDPRTVQRYYDGGILPFIQFRPGGERRVLLEELRRFADRMGIPLNPLNSDNSDNSDI